MTTFSKRRVLKAVFLMQTISSGDQDWRRRWLLVTVYKRKSVIAKGIFFNSYFNQTSVVHTGMKRFISVFSREKSKGEEDG